MKSCRPLLPEFEKLLSAREEDLALTHIYIREKLLELVPDANELLYNSHALTIAFSLSDKLSDAFCHLPIYKSHINLGFNHGAHLQDKHDLLQGTGKSIRHIKMVNEEDFNEEVIELIESAIELASSKQKSVGAIRGQTISHL